MIANHSGSHLCDLQYVISIMILVFDLYEVCMPALGSNPQHANPFVLQVCCGTANLQNKNAKTHSKRSPPPASQLHSH